MNRVICGKPGDTGRLIHPTPHLAYNNKMLTILKHVSDTRGTHGPQPETIIARSAHVLIQAAHVGGEFQYLKHVGYTRRTHGPQRPNPYPPTVSAPPLPYRTHRVTQILEILWLWDVG